MQKLPVAAGPGLLRGDSNAFIHGGRVVRANLRADAVFEGRDDFSTCRVIFGICAEDDSDIEREANGIALNLHVAFLHDVKQADLNFSGEVWKLVNGEDAPIRARQQSVMNRELARKFMPTAGRFDGVNVADEVRDCHVGRSELLHVAIVGREIRNRSRVSQARDFFAATTADRRVRIVANLAAGEIRHMRIKQCRKRAQNTAFRLSSQAEQNEVVPRENRVHNLWHNRIVIADNAGKNTRVITVTQAGDQVFTKLVFHTAGAQTIFGKDTAAQFAERMRKTHETPRKNLVLNYTLEATSSRRHATM